MSFQIPLLLSHEIASFKKLHKNAQFLFASILLYNLAYPILFIFVNAYLFRETKDIQSVAWYMIVNYAGLPLGFFINGLLLKTYNPTRLFLMGNILRGLSVVFLIFIGNITYISILLFGFISGISGGLHWANRNYITLRTTKSHNRIYFSTLDNSSSILSSIIVPIIVGWFIIFGSKIHTYSPIIAYQIISLLALVILIFSGLVIRNVIIPIPSISKMFFLHASRFWLKLRIFSIIHGILDGMKLVIPIIITLTFLGKEDVLGTTQSYMAILSAFALYIIGKLMKINQRILILSISLLLAAIGSLLFGLTFSVVGVLFYITLQAFADPFNQVCFTSLSYDAMDKEEKITKNHHYSYILDQEIFHNVGRVSGIFIFILFIHLFSTTFAIRFTPLIFVTSQIFLLLVAKNIEKTNK